MSLWHRAPREVYRVYGEDQYLDGEIASQKNAATVEPDSRAGASWAAFAADVPPDTTDGSSVRPNGSHAGRLIGVGLLVGVGLATLALVFLNVSHRHGAVPELVGQSPRVEAEQRVDRASGAGRARVIAYRVKGGKFRPRASLPRLR